MKTEEAYRAAPGLNWSTLKPYATSPAAAKWLEDNGRPDSPSMAWGRLVHCFVLEPDQVEKRWAVYDGRRGTKAYQAWQDENPGIQDVKPAEWRSAYQASIMISAHQAAGHLFRGEVETEIPIAWTCPDTGIDCKAKIDAVRPQSRTLIDLKTTRSIEAGTFGRQAAAMGYHGQLAHYAQACEHGLGWRPSRVVIVAVESAPPFDVAVFDLDDDALWAGEHLRAELIETWRRCRDEKAWPGRYPQAQPLRLPSWAYPTHDLTDLEIIKED